MLLNESLVQIGKSEPMQSICIQTAFRQPKLATALLFAIPVMVFFHLGSRLNGSDDAFEPVYMSLLGLCALSLAISGYLIIKKFTGNITWLRKYFLNLSVGRINGELRLYQSVQCTDLGQTESFRDIQEIDERISGLDTICEILNRIHDVSSKREGPYIDVARMAS